MTRKSSASRYEESSRFIFIIQATLLFAALSLSHKILLANCEAKEFDWSELGVSLTGPKSALNANAANNLRILVSPQRRMTKNYEIDYSNNSQPTSSQGEASYVIPGSGNSYMSQSSGQISPSSAYSALSASLASLKNRLSARGVTLAGSMSEGSSQPNIYQNTAGTYGSSLMGESQQQQAQQHSQAQPQATYLSVASQQDQQSSGGYSGAQNQNSNDNKTIVLAIPAKINFLTDSRSSSSSKQQQPQQQQQTQQMAVIQSSNDQQQQQQQQARPEYAGKQITMISSQEGSVDQTGGQMMGRDTNADQEQHQYVIVNTPTQSNDHPQLVTNMANIASMASMGQSGVSQVQAAAPIYQSVYQTPAIQQQQQPQHQQPQSNMGSFAVKYIPTYQQAGMQPQPQPQQQQPIQKMMYSTGEQSMGNSYETQVNEQSVMGRYGGCIDTCNSADVRWRKHSVAKYKYCCSRSLQYDPQFEQPSAEKVSEVSAKHVDDAYYNYLYRRSRSRRSRRPNRASSSNRYHGRYSSTASNSDEDSMLGDSGSSVDSGRQTSSRSHHYESPYMKHYKSRHQSSHEPSEMTRDGPDSAPTGNGGKYAPKERSYRRGRSRDFDSTPESQPAHDSNHEDEGSYPSPPSESSHSRTSSGYGSGEYSVEAGRYPSESRQPSVNDEDETRGPSYDDQSESDSSSENGSAAVAESSEYPIDQQAADGPTEEGGESETTSSYKYTANRRRKAHGKNRSRKGQSGKESKMHHKKSRKFSKFSKLEHPTSQTNETDYESAQVGDQYHPESSTAQNEGDEQQQQQQSYQKEQSSGTESNGDAEKDAMSLSNKYKPSLNESAVANLSKTTAHLKEILSILEKKAHLKANESSTGQNTNQQQQQTTSTPAPPTTTSLYPLSIYSSQFNSPSLQGALSSEFSTSELNLKSPYRFEPSSFSSPQSMSLPSAYSSLASDTFNPLAPTFGTPPSQYMSSAKHMSLANGQQPRKRRVNKNARYNSLMMAKTHGLGASSSLLHSSKSPFMSPAYALQYPYWYSRGSSPLPSSITNSYPYRNLNKHHYSSILNERMTAKLAAAASGGLYSDESRFHPSMTNYDPLANVASSLRPSTTMRLRSKPFVFQPHVLPIYTRHTILTQPLDVKK